MDSLVNRVVIGVYLRPGSYLFITKQGGQYTIISSPLAAVYKCGLTYNNIVITFLLNWRMETKLTKLEEVDNVGVYKCRVYGI